jgi:phosphopantothenoylcysteine decarboxylase/phosphopantothenate--cysteine ligase
MLDGRTIHLCVSGGVACYKAVSIARELIKAGAGVRVAMTPNARKFVGPLTFQAITRQPVLTETLDPWEDLQIGHIAFAQQCDALLVAPATANMIGKAAHGLGDEVVSTALLAANVPVLVAPAMNTFMWDNPAVADNIARLRGRGWTVIEPTAGELACGHVGPGRLAEPDAIAAAVAHRLTPKRLARRRIVVAAGPTREAIDPVRFLSNPSSGKSGFALAEAAAAAGAEVTLVHGPVGLLEPRGVHVVPVVSAEQMNHAVCAAAEGADAVVMTAAVADWRPGSPATSKQKKAGTAQSLDLVRTPDILAGLGAARSGDRPLLVGYAAETGDPVPEARDKLSRKGCDLVVANDVSAAGAGFGTDENRVWLVSADGVEALPMMSKRAIGERLVAWMADQLDGGQG